MKNTLLIALPVLAIVIAIGTSVFAGDCCQAKKSCCTTKEACCTTQAK